MYNLLRVGHESDTPNLKYMALWDPETRTITGEFAVAFEHWKYSYPPVGPIITLVGPLTEQKLVAFPLEWSMSRRGCTSRDTATEYCTPNQQEQADNFLFLYPNLTRMPEGLNFFFSVNQHELDSSIEMRLCQKDGNGEDIFTQRTAFLEFVKNKDGATATQAYRVQNLWKLEAILNTGLIYGAQNKLAHLKEAMESSQTEQEKTFYGAMIRELVGRHWFRTRDCVYLMNAWGSDWALRMHCYVTEYPSRLELIEGSARRTTDEENGPIVLSADYKNIATGVVKQMYIKQDLSAKEPSIQVRLWDPMSLNSRSGLNFHMEQYGNGDRGNLWEMEASVKVMLLSNDEFMHQIPSLLRWIRCARTDDIRGYLLEMLKSCVGGDMTLFHELMVLSVNQEVRDQEDVSFPYKNRLREEEERNLPIQRQQPIVKRSNRRLKRCIIV